MSEFKLSNRLDKLNLEKNHIESIIIYGSFVRGDFDSKSDIDFFIVVDDCYMSTLNKIKDNIAYELKIPHFWISIFTKSEVTRRCKKGDYFIWSVKLEGTIIYSRSGFIENQFDNINLYSLDTIRDELKSIYNDLEKKILGKAFTRKQLENKIYVIAKIVRDLCIKYNYMNGIIEFSNLGAIEEFFNIIETESPFSINEYKELLFLKRVFKSTSARYLPMNEDINIYVGKWTKKLIKLLNLSVKCLNRVYDNDFISPLLNIK
ncbi:hypothetical protein JCM1393_26460 [Clostridium carnis]